MSENETPTPVPSADQVAPSLVDRIRQATEEMVLKGDLPDWLTMESYDTARIRFSEEEGATVLIASPPRSAIRRFSKVQEDLSTLALKSHDGKDVDEDLRRLGEEVEAAEVALYTAVILEVGPALVFRCGIVHAPESGDGVAYSPGDRLPAPRDVKDPELRKLVLFDGFPEFVLRRISDAIGFLRARGQGIASIAGGRSGNS